MRGLKRQPGPDLTILGSGSLIRQLAEAGLIDEFQLIITPVAIGGGRTSSKASQKDRARPRLLPHLPRTARFCSSTNPNVHKGADGLTT
jgi:dihydrofolate reductase